MHSDYYVRLAGQCDLPRLREIEIESTRRFMGMGLIDHLPVQSMCVEKLSNLIDKEQVWTVCLAKEPIGFAAASVLQEAAYLEEMDVLPEHGSRGLGTRLVKTICEWAVKQELPAIVLSTFESVAWNAPFYQRRGFKYLPAEQWSKELQRIRNKESEDGLPIDKRVFMLLDLTSNNQDII